MADWIAAAKVSIALSALVIGPVVFALLAALIVGPD